MNSDTGALIFLLILWGGFIVGALYVYRERKKS